MSHVFSKIGRFCKRPAVIATPMALLMLALAVFPALAHHPAGSASASCTGYDVSGSYVGGSQYRWLEWNVTMTVDGVPEVIAGSWNGVNPGFEIFSRTGSGPHDVTVTGWIKMYGDNSVSEDTYTATRSSDSSSGPMTVDFQNFDRQVLVTADPGYSITFVGIDYSGSDANEVTFGPQASPFFYDAPGNEDIEHVTVTVYRPASHSKGSLLDTYTYNFSFNADSCFGTRYYAESTCDGWTVYEQTTVNGQDYGDPIVVDSGVWTDPLEQEVAYSHDLTIEEPTDCHEVTVRYYAESTCDGWTVYEQTVVDGQDYGQPTIMDSGAWIDPYTLEQAQSYGLVIDEPADCLELRDATVSVDVGVCRWDGESSSTAVTFTLTGGVTVLLSGPDGSQSFTESTTLVLPPGSYSWSAVADEGYRIVGPADGSFLLTSCEPGEASVTVQFGTCEVVEGAAVTPVSFTLVGDVTVTLIGPNGYELVFSESIELELGDGHYTWTAVAGEGYEIEGPSEGEFDLRDCRPPCPECQCPTCGAPIQETMGESMGIAWFSDVPCTGANCEVWYQEHNPWVKLWTPIQSFYTHEGATTPLTAVTTANGEVCYEAFFRDGETIGEFILWGPGGEGDRIRESFPASDPQPHKYSACSIFPSWCDTRLGEDGLGYALWLPGHNVSDWAQFLLQNGFFPGEEHRGTLALEWAAALRENGNAALLTWDGNLDSLPLFPLPPR